MFFAEVIAYELHTWSIFAEYFGEYAESVPDGASCSALSQMARDNGVHLVGGSIPEREGETLYNTSTVWTPDGTMIAKHRKVSSQILAFRSKVIYAPGGLDLNIFIIVEHRLYILHDSLCQNS